MCRAESHCSGPMQDCLSSPFSACPAENGALSRDEGSAGVGELFLLPAGAGGFLKG